MSPIQFLTVEQAALIPEYQEKWRRIYLSTQPIDPRRAAAAVKQAYTVMGTKAPDEIVLCPSPHAALAHLQASIDRVEISPELASEISPGESQQGSVKFFVRAGWEMIKLMTKKQFASTKPLHDLQKEVASDSSKILGRQVDLALPQDLTMQDLVEQSFNSLTLLVRELAKELALTGNNELLNIIQNKLQSDWRTSFNMTAAAIDTQLAWLPATGFLFRGWPYGIALIMLTVQIYGVKHPKFRETIFESLSLSPLAQKFLQENPPVVISNLTVLCTLDDFLYSEIDGSSISPKWATLQDLVRECGWIFAVDDICIVCDRPTKILLDEDNQLHGEGEPALEFADGFVAYACHGTPLPAQYGSVHPDLWQPAWILTAENPGWRQVLMQSIGAIRICQELSMTALESTPEYTLLKIDNIGNGENRIFKHIDPVTGEIEAIFVPHHLTSVRSAIQFAHQKFSGKFPISDQDREQD